MKKQIIVEKERKAALRKAFDVTEVMIWKALSFESNSELANKIRRTAIKEYGGEMVPAIKMVTRFENDDMKQTFGPRVMIVVSMKTGRTSVLIDGEVKKQEDDLSISELMNLQQEVMNIAQDLQLQN